MTMQGGCLCGAVRYSTSGSPVATAVCHCTSCQKQSGASFSVNLLLLQTQVTIDGELAAYVDKNEDNQDVVRKFCPACGSPILSELASHPGLVAIKGGTLDDSTKLNPTAQFWTRSKQNWLSIDQLPTFEKDAPTA